MIACLLAYSSVEPTDEQFESLMRGAAAEATKKAETAQEKFWKSVQSEIKQELVAHGD